MTPQRINELRDELEAERISLDELAEIEEAATEAGIDITQDDGGMMASDMLDQLAATLEANCVPIKIVVYCSGGVVTGVSTNAPSGAEVVVVDYDDAVDFEGDFEDSDERTDAYESSLSFPDGTTLDEYAAQDAASLVY